MAETFYVGCRCPECRAKLDGVEEHSRCPACKSELEAAKVWETRSYAGVVVLPTWVRAFGWPLVLIAAGVGFFLWAYHYGEISFAVPGFLISLGLILFVVRLSAGNSRY